MLSVHDKILKFVVREKALMSYGNALNLPHDDISTARLLEMAVRTAKAYESVDVSKCNSFIELAHKVY